MDIQPFQIQIPDGVLEDLRERLAHTRWPDEIPGSGWDYGADLAYMKELVEYWRTGFDWRAQEEALNAFSHYRADMDGLGIHFIHERGKGPNPTPIIITHGWPGLFLQELKVIPLLTDPASHGGDPADSFDVVVPSLPGYGFSDRPAQRGVNHSRIAHMWSRLMTEGLGYHRFGAFGSDWGASVTAHLAYNFPEQLIGIQLTSIGTPQPYLGPGERDLSERERAYIEQRDAWQRDEGGYNHLQRTKPQTLSYGLNDSPAGLAAWLVDRIRTWDPNDDAVERRRLYTEDEILTNITIFWATQSIGSSCRLYYETAQSPWEFVQGEKIQVPCAVAIMEKDQTHAPREWAERIYDVRRWAELPKGGHFPNWEAPEVVAQELRNTFRAFQQ